jgi:hypothetical protein
VETRGNGALCSGSYVMKNKLEEIKETIVDVVENNSDRDHVGTGLGCSSPAKIYLNAIYTGVSKFFR